MGYNDYRFSSKEGLKVIVNDPFIISIQETAEKIGYSSTQAFAKNFQEKYQIPPSYFLNRLNEEEENKSMVK